MSIIQDIYLIIYIKKVMLKAIFLIIVLIFNIAPLASQEWTVPVNVSNGSSFIYQPDMVIDSNGTIHVVWCHVLASNFSKLFYSFSTDDGETWAQPTDILQNTSIRMDQPHIVVDKRNHIYVTYDYGVGTTNRYVNMVINDGTGWSEPVYF